MDQFSFSSYRKLALKWHPDKNVEKREESWVEESYDEKPECWYELWWAGEGGGWADVGGGGGWLW